MKTFNKFTIFLLYTCLAITLAACQKGDNSQNSPTEAAAPSAQTNISVPKEETKQDTEGSTASEPTETLENSEKRGLPEGVVLSGIDFTVTDEEPDDVTYGEDGIWWSAAFEDFVYASEPGETELKKYRVGDTLIGLPIKSAGFSFMNMYMDNDYHESGGRVNSSVTLDGTLTLTGTLSVVEEDSELIFNKGDIMFSPDEENIFPRLGGLFEGEEKYYFVFCGNLEDEELCEEVKELAAGDEARAEITVSDISIGAQMGVPISGRIDCKIDSAKFL